VPPPPVCGATVGLWGGLVAEVGVGVLEAGGLAEELGLVVGLVLEVALLEAVGLDVLVDVGGEWVGPDEDEDEDPPSVQPVTVTDVRMAKTPKPMAARFALSTAPAMVTCTVM
jgi:hypothetical protein